MDGDFIWQCGGLISRQTAFMAFQEAEHWKSRALLAENNAGVRTKSPQGNLPPETPNQTDGAA